ncbi:T9SS type A sorting domain-containing protein [Halosquirtibacter xylanolyticus]|uniref:T9SS type A sorting domain-containing protein n=1 Tax=Halosquirtibacter xylanolyticus TaxID=3374599 RepID=UPI00374A3AEB|nr:T9SS type A sorting domain-containing protein [Prolixibacteraceae bacterium]
MLLEEPFAFKLLILLILLTVHSVIFGQSVPPPPPVLSGVPVYNKNKSPHIVSVVYNEKCNYRKTVRIEGFFEDKDGKVKSAFLTFKESGIKWDGTYDEPTKLWVFSGYINSLGEKSFLIQIEDDESAVTVSDTYKILIEAITPRVDQEIVLKAFSNMINLTYIANDINTEYLNVTILNENTNHIVSQKRIDVELSQQYNCSFNQLSPLTNYLIRVEYCNRFVCSGDIFEKNIGTTRLLPSIELELVEPSAANDWCDKWGDIGSIDVTAKNLVQDVIFHADSKVRISRDKNQWWSLEKSYVVEKSEFTNGEVRFFVQCKHHESGVYSHEIEFEYDQEMDPEVIVLTRLVKTPISTTQFDITKTSIDKYEILDVNWESKSDQGDYDGLYLIISKTPTIVFDPNNYCSNGTYYVHKYSKDVRSAKIVPPFQSKKVYLKVIPFNYEGDTGILLQEKSINIKQVFSGLHSSIPEIFLYGGGKFENGQWAFGVCVEQAFRDDVFKDLSIKLFDINGEVLDVVPISEEFVERANRGMSVLLPPIMSNAKNVSIEPCSVALFYKEKLIEYQKIGVCKSPKDSFFDNVVPSVSCKSEEITENIEDRWCLFLTTHNCDRELRSIHLSKLKMINEYRRRISIGKMVWQGKNPSCFCDPENWMYHKSISTYSDVVIPKTFGSVTFDDRIVANDIIYSDRTHFYGLNNLTPNQFLSCHKIISPGQWYYICPTENICNMEQWEPESGSLYIKRWNGRWVDLDPTEQLKHNQGYIIYSTKSALCVENNFMFCDSKKTEYYTIDEEVEVKKWALIGNPCGLYHGFPHDIEDFTTSFIYVFDSEKPGYQVYNGNMVSLDEKTPFTGIAPNEAFFVEQLSDGTITWNPNAEDVEVKSSGKNHENDYSITMNVFNEDRSEKDNLKVVLSQNASDSYFLKEDAVKLIYQKNGLPQIYSVVDGKNLVIDQRKIKNQKIEFQIQSDKMKQIILTIDEMNYQEQNTHLWIEKVGDRQCWDFKRGGEIELSVDGNVESNRFRLHIDIIEQEMSNMVLIQNIYHGVCIRSLTEVEKQISIFNVLGSKIESFQFKGINEESFTLNPGIYLLKVVSVEGMYTSKFVVY